MKFPRTQTFFVLPFGIGAALLVRAQDNAPFTEQQALDMVKAGRGNDAGAKIRVECTFPRCVS